jgi:HSP20 family protein
MIKSKVIGIMKKSIYYHNSTPYFDRTFVPDFSTNQKRNPEKYMKNLARRNVDVFPSFVSDFFRTSPFMTGLFDVDMDLLPARLGVTMPSANFTENEKEYLIELAAPGLSKKDFTIEIENDLLTVSAQKEEEKNEKENGFTKKEYSFNSFNRSFALPENAKSEKIDAKYENGILTIHVPKKEFTPIKPKKEIPIS